MNDDIVENPFLEEKKEPRKKRKKVVFVVAEPDQKNNKYPEVLKILDQKDDILVLHNQFNYENEIGQKVLKQLKKQDLPTSKHLWERLMRQEFWGIKQAELVIFDLDNLASFHLMSAAAIFEKPMVCISQTLKPVPAYFSGSVIAVIKPTDIEIFLKNFKRKKTISKKKEESPKPVNGDLQNKIQNMIHKSLVKHVEKNMNGLDDG